MTEHMADLVLHAKTGNEEAIRSLMDQTENYVFFVARGFVKNDDDAQEITQRAYIKAFQSLESLADNSKFQPWLISIVNRCALNYLDEAHHRHDVNFSALERENDQGEVSFYDSADERIEIQPELNLDTQEKQRIIREILDGLPEKQRAVVILHFFEDKKIPEIARELNTNENTIKSRLNYAKGYIREKTEAYEKKEGIKLYNIAPLTIFMYLLKGIKEDMTDRPGSKQATVLSEKAVADNVDSWQKAQKTGKASTAEKTAETIKDPAEGSENEKSASSEATVRFKTGSAASVWARFPVGATIGIGIALVAAGIGIGTVIRSANGGTQDADASGMKMAEVGESTKSAAETATAEGKAPESSQSVVWVVKPSMDFDDVLPLEQDILDCSLCSTLTGYPATWVNSSPYVNDKTKDIGYSPNVVKIEKDNLFGLYDYSGNQLQSAQYTDIGSYPCVFKGFYVTSDSVSGSTLSTDYMSLTSTVEPIGACGCDPYLFPAVKNGAAGYTYETAEGSEFARPGETISNGMKAYDLPDTDIVAYTLNDNNDIIGYSYVSPENFSVAALPGKEIGDSVRYVGKAVNGYVLMSSVSMQEADDTMPHLAFVQVPSGRQITDFKLEDAGYFMEGYAPVKIGGKWGFIDTNGNLVTECVFEDASNVYNGKAYVKAGALWGIIDLQSTLKQGIAVNPTTVYQYNRGKELLPSAKAEEDSLGTIHIMVSGLNIRNNPSLTADKNGVAESGQTFPVKDTADADGYTWYRIGNNQWIASKEGEWTIYTP